VGRSKENDPQPLWPLIIVGFTVSTALTLFFVHALYTVFEERMKREAKEE
jgi:multidrug efflux pump subunit AcrB